MIAAPLCAIALLVALHIVQITPDGLWGKTLLNSVHVFVFALVALLVYAGLSLAPSLTAGHRLLITAIACGVLGAVSEAAQMTGPRDASYGDLVLDYLGAAATLLIIAAFTPGARHQRRWLLTSSGLALLIVALLPLISVSAAYVWRNHSFPVLVSFDSPLVRTFIRAQNADLNIRRSESGGVGVISLRKGAWPGLVVHDLWPDWTEFDALVIGLGIPGDEPLQIHIRVHDRRHRDGEQLYNDRFNTTLKLEPGEHTVRLPLEDIRNGPATRVMNLANIDGLVIFCTRSETGRAFELREIRLE